MSSISVFYAELGINMNLPNRGSRPGGAKSYGPALPIEVSIRRAFGIVPSAQGDDYLGHCINPLSLWIRE